MLADEAITRRFLAGVIPGLMQAAAIAAWVTCYAQRRGYAREQKIEPGERWRRTLFALPALSVPVIVPGGR